MGGGLRFGVGVQWYKSDQFFSAAVERFWVNGFTGVGFKDMYPANLEILDLKTLSSRP